MNRLLLMGLALGAVACTNEIAGLGPPSNPATESYASSLGIDLSKMSVTPNGVYYRDLTIGTGLAITKDTTVTLNYSGYLTDGTEFDSNPSALVYTSEVVKGFRDGLMAGGGMRVGGIRQIIVPSSLGYGSAGNPPNIPRQATLVFRVQLVAIDSSA